MKTETHTHTENCRALFELLSQYLDQELDESLCREIQGHIEGCLPCRVCVETLRRTIQICREAFQGEPELPTECSRNWREIFTNLRTPT